MSYTYVGSLVSKLSGVGGRFGDCQNRPSQQQKQPVNITQQTFTTTQTTGKYHTTDLHNNRNHR